MNIRQRLMHAVGMHFFERFGNRMSYADAVSQLEDSGQRISAAMRTAAATPHNVSVARHIIGIERWSLVRMREYVGAMPFTEEYDHYQPDAHLGLTAIADEMDIVRAEVIALTKQLMHHDPGNTTVNHNDLGPLSARGWLYYVLLHANFESKKLRK
jgi:hypothetical protein